MKMPSALAAGVCLVAATAIAMSIGHASESLTSLKPGVSAVDAFMAREPSPPASGEEAVHLMPLVGELDKRLDEEDTLLQNRANNLGAQAIPGGLQDGDGSAPSISQAMAMATQMRSNGTLQAMMLIGKFSSDAHHQAHELLWTQRVQEAAAALQNADDWLEEAKDRLNGKLQAKLDACPQRQTGELREPDPTCVRSAKLDHQEKVHQLATAYLQKVADPLGNVLLTTKMLVDEQEEFAKKMKDTGKGPLVAGQVANFEGMSIRNIKKYNDLLTTAVDAAADLAAFKADLGQ